MRILQIHNAYKFAGGEDSVVDSEFQLLKDDEVSYQDLLENTNDIPYAMNNEGQLTYVGPQVRRYGLEPEEVLAEAESAAAIFVLVMVAVS